MDKVIGTCSLCGGAVCTPQFWGGTTPPIPTCRSCGAQPANKHGPVIPMVRPSPIPPMLSQEVLEAFDKEHGTCFSKFRSWEDMNREAYQNPYPKP